MEEDKMVLEVGMYCYNKINRKLGIGKIVGFRENNNAIIKYVSDIVILSIGNIVASYNIIDLIGVGDFVNGMRIVAKDSDNRLYVAEDLGESYDRVFNNGYFEHTILEADKYKILNIVTKEQFNSMKYVVGEQE